MPGCLAAAFKSVNAIKNTVFQTDSTKMQSFWGKRKAYRRLIKYFSRIACPFNDYLGNNKEYWSGRTTEAQAALTTLKSKLKIPPVLAFLQLLSP